MRLTSHGWTDEVAHARRQHLDAVRVRQAVHADQMHQEDGGQCVVGRDEEAVESSRDTQLSVSVQERHDSRHQTYMKNKTKKTISLD